MRLAGKVAIITGGGSGMGREAARLFAAEGAKVVIADYQGVYGRAVGRETVEQLQAAGHDSRYVECDVSSEAAVNNLIAETVAAYGQIDILYNNASHGFSSPFGQGDITDLDLTQWDAMINNNLKSVFLCCRAVLPHMIAAGGGSIINTGSISALVGVTGADAYTAAKGGVVSLTRVLAVRYGAKGIRVNCIAPGSVATPMMKGYADNPDIAPKIARKIPLGRLGDPAEVARVALFLASDDSSYVTGVIIPVDGGWTAL